MPNLIGTGPSQVPTNADLGSMAHQEASGVTITGGAVVLNANQNSGYFIDTNISDTRPSFSFDFINSKELDPRITLTRASKASYFDGETFVKGDENLISWSEQIGNSSWTLSNTTAFNNIGPAPNGTMTATLLTENSVNSVHYAMQTVYGVNTNVGDFVTLSCFVKAGSRSFVSIGTDNAGAFPTGVDCIFNLTSQTVTHTYGPIVDYSIKAYEYGWFRCSVTCRTTAVGNVVARAYICNGGTASNIVYTGDSTGSIWLWGYQVEVRSFLTGYVKTEATPVQTKMPLLKYAGINEARFDFDTATYEPKGLLIEHSSNNSIYPPLGESIGTFYGTYNINYLKNATIAPDGSNTAIKHYAPTSWSGTNQHYISRAINISAGVNYTITIYAKAAERDVLWLYVTNAAAITGGGYAAYAFFNLRDGTYSNAYNTVNVYSSYHGNGWWRVGFTFTGLNTASSTIELHSSVDSSGYYYDGDGFSGMYLWGLQHETNSFPTSYIPNASNAAVTRAADTVTIQPNIWTPIFNTSASTFYCETIPMMPGTLPNYPYILATNMYSNYGALMYLGPSTANRTTYTPYSMAGGGSDIGFNVTNGQITKIATSFDNKGKAVATDGSILSQVAEYVGPATQGYIRTNGQLYIGSSGYTSSSNYTGYIRKLSYYPTRLSAQEMQEMTL